MARLSPDSFRLVSRATDAEQILCDGDTLPELVAQTQAQSCLLHDRSRESGWIVETLRLLGAETRMGIKLHSTFVAAGLPEPSMRLGAVVGGGVHGADYLKLITDLVETLLPAMQRLGVATATDVDVETLSERISREVISSDSVIVGRAEIGAWSRVQGSPPRDEGPAALSAVSHQK